jgi:hypothetical protein
MDDQQKPRTYTVKDEQTGRLVTFQWHDASDPTDADMAEVFAAAGPTQEKKPEPSLLQKAGKAFIDYVPNPVGIVRGLRKATQPENLPSAGAIGGGILGGIVGNVPGAIAGAGIGGALGKGGEIMADDAAGRDVPTSAGGVLGAMATRGAGEAALQAAGGVVGKGAQLVGRGMYRGALLPINQVLGKYGDIVKEGVRRGVPVDRGGIKTVAGLKNKALSDKELKLAQAGERVSILPNRVVGDTLTDLGDDATKLREAGLGDPTERYRKQATEVIVNNPRGISPVKLEEIKRTHDNRLGGAFQKLRKREPISPKEQFGVGLVKKIGETQEQIVPGYGEMNREIMNVSGLEQALKRRVLGSGGNQGLENALTMAATAAAGPAALPGRLVMMPPVLSRAGIAADRAGQASKYGLPPAVRAALMALMDEK